MRLNASKLPFTRCRELSAIWKTARFSYQFSYPYGTSLGSKQTDPHGVFRSILSLGLQGGKPGLKSEDSSSIPHQQSEAGSRDIPTQPLDPDDFKSSFNDILRRSSVPVLLDSEFSFKDAKWICELNCTVDGEAFQAVGRNVKRKRARNNAYLHLLSQIYESGKLEKPLNNPSTGSSQLLGVEISKSDLFYYCSSHFDSIPEFTNHALQTKPEVRVEVTARLEKYGIKVSSVNKELKSAETAASNLLKAAIELFIAGVGGQGLPERSRIDSQENVRNFIESYKLYYPDSSISVSVTQDTSARIHNVIPFIAQTLLDGEPIGTPAVEISKRDAELMALLTGALELKKREPSVYAMTFKALSENVPILRSIQPVNVQVDPDCFLIMRDQLVESRRLGLSDFEEQLEATELPERPFRPWSLSLDPKAIKRRSRQLKRRYVQSRHNEPPKSIQKVRKDLPIHQHRAEVLDIVHNNQYSIIIGATGSGKSTQLPQVLLDQAIENDRGAECNIICTQPRRIAAKSVARRVAQERGEPLGRTCGYSVRFDQRLPEPGGSITYCTSGALLNFLKHYPDQVLDSTSHLILDEIHERDMQSDLLLLLLRREIEQRIQNGRNTPKIVLMSATIDPEPFSRYLTYTSPIGQSVKCPSLSIPGRTFPVQELYLDDILPKLEVEFGAMGFINSDDSSMRYLQREYYLPKFKQFPGPFPLDMGGPSQKLGSGEGIEPTESEDDKSPINLIAATCAYIAKESQDGSVLVFLPGMDDILKVEQALRNEPLAINFNDQNKFRIYLLHSQIQEGSFDIFESVPDGVRKIILATNIAETSITVPDVAFIVDSGKMKQVHYDQSTRTSKLLSSWISRSQTKQRCGRAGRVRSGQYYALFSRDRHNSLSDFSRPELLGSDLQGVCLGVAARSFDVPIDEFLSQAMDPPDPKAVALSVERLKSLQALTADGRITWLGRAMEAMPVHPSLAKMIVLGIIFRCLDSMLILACAHGDYNLLLSPRDQRSIAREIHVKFMEGSGSDHIALLNAFRRIRDVHALEGYYASRQFAEEYYIDHAVFSFIDSSIKQIYGILLKTGLIPSSQDEETLDRQLGHPILNQNSHNILLIKGLIVKGAYPNLAVNSAGGSQFRTKDQKHAIAHPSSINYSRYLTKSGIRFPPGTLMVYSRMSATADEKGLFMRDTSLCGALTAILFAGRVELDKKDRLVMDKWLTFNILGDKKNVKILLEFRRALDRLLTKCCHGLADPDKDENILTDNQELDSFIVTLKEILDRDVRVSDAIASFGWSSEERKGPENSTLNMSRMLLPDSL